MSRTVRTIAALTIATAAIVGVASPSTAGGRPRVAEGVTVQQGDNLAGTGSRVSPRLA